jgi:hypothetical protein
MGKMKLSEIKRDESIMARKLNVAHAMDFAESMASGAKFPPLLVERTSHVLLGGYHRMYAYERYFSEDGEVDVEFVDCKTPKDMLLMAGEDNEANGFRMETNDRKNFIFRAQDLGASRDEVLAALGISEERYEKWSAERVVIRGTKGKGYAPAKLGVKHLQGEEVSKEVAENIKEHYVGMVTRQLAKQIIMRIDDNTIDIENESDIEALRELNTKLAKYLNNLSRRTA